MKDHSTRYYVLGTLLCMTIITALVLTTGCLSVSLIGGRHQNVTFLNSDNNDDASPDMQADSKTSDLLKDLLKDLKFPGSGSVPLPEVPPAAPVPPPSGDGSPQTPGDLPTSPPPVPPGAGDEDTQGTQTFLWKPVSDNNGRLVVLLPASFNGQVESVTANGAALAYAGQGNGNRSHWRGEWQGGGYGTQVMVVATLKTGDAQVWTVPRGDTRYEAAWTAPAAPPADEQPTGDPVPSDDTADALTLLWDGKTLTVPDWLEAERVALYAVSLASPGRRCDCRGTVLAIGPGVGLVQIDGVTDGVMADVQLVEPGTAYVRAVYAVNGAWPYPFDQGLAQPFGAPYNGAQKWVML